MSLPGRAEGASAWTCVTPDAWTDDSFYSLPICSQVGCISKDLPVAQEGDARALEGWRGLKVCDTGSEQSRPLTCPEIGKEWPQFILEGPDDAIYHCYDYIIKEGAK